MLSQDSRNTASLILQRHPSNFQVLLPPRPYPLHTHPGVPLTQPYAPRSMSGVTVKDCDAAEFIKALAEHFKQVTSQATLFTPVLPSCVLAWTLSSSCGSGSLICFVLCLRLYRWIRTRRQLFVLLCPPGFCLCCILGLH
jgi:hypothetical protein